MGCILLLLDEASRGSRVQHAKNKAHSNKRNIEVPERNTRDVKHVMVHLLTRNGRKKKTEPALRIANSNCSTYTPYIYIYMYRDTLSWREIIERR